MFRSKEKRERSVLKGLRVLLATALVGGSLTTLVVKSAEASPLDRFPPNMQQHGYPSGPVGWPPIDLAQVNAARQQLTLSAHNSVVTAGVISVRYPQGWAAEYVPNAIRVKHPDGVSIYEVGFGEAGPNMSPDAIFEKLILPSVRQNAQDVRVLGATSSPTPMGSAKEYFLTGVYQGRRVFGNLVLITTPVPGISIPGVSSVPGPTIVQLVSLSGPQERLPILYAMAQETRAVPAGGAGQPMEAPVQPDFGRRTGDRNAEWQAQQEERRKRNEEWNYRTRQYHGRAEDWRRDRDIYRRVDPAQGGGQPDQRLYPGGRPFGNRRNY